MNTKKRTPLALTSLALALGAVACGGGSASLSVEDGVVTETHEIVTADDLGHLRVTISYPEARLLAGEITHVGVEARPKLPSIGDRIQPQRPGTKLDIPRIPQRHALATGLTAKAPARGPGLAPVASEPHGPTLDIGVEQAGLRYGIPEWMDIEVQGADADRYSVVLVRPGDQDDRVNPGALDRD